MMQMSCLIVVAVHNPIFTAAQCTIVGCWVWHAGSAGSGMAFKSSSYEKMDAREMAREQNVDNNKKELSFI